MSKNTQQKLAGVMDAIEPAIQQGMPADNPVSPWRKFHSYLRGRYIWVTLLSLTLAGLGGWGGYKLWKPSYTSVGLIRVKPILPRVIYTTEQNQILPMYDAYIGAQASLIKSQRVVDLAMQKPEWKNHKRGLTDETITEFRESLIVERPHASELITVRFTDENPKAAVSAVKTVIEAYMDIFGEQEMERGEITIKTLIQRRSILESEVKSLHDRIQRMASQYGSLSFDQEYKHRLEHFHTIDSILKQIQAEVIEVDVAADTPRPDSPDLTPMQIAQVNPTMNVHLERKARLDFELADLKRHHKDHHPKVRNAKVQIKYVNRVIEDEAREYNELLTRTSQGEDSPEALQRSLQKLEKRREKYLVLFDNAREEALNIGQKNVHIDSLQNDLESTQTYLNQTNERLVALRVESKVQGRIAIISDGDQPRSPINKAIKKQLILFGALCGLALGVGMFVLIGMSNRRYRFIEDTHENMGHLKLLGVLPQLPSDLSEPEQAATAAHAVQQIRTLLQLGPSLDERHVFVVTSAMPGDGKTSLVMALGLSFAASGSRTLLVDFDLRGHGLTNQADSIVRRKIGQVLLQEGPVTADELSQGLELARKSHIRLGEALTELNYLSEVEVDHALGLQAESAKGLPEALDGEDLAGCVYETDMPLLSILPIGGASSEFIGRLSPAVVSRLLYQAKHQFNTILVDTGPVPASIEASLVASQADAVVFTVSQGVQQDMVQRALGHLNSIGANVGGLVFNRAKIQDLERYSSSRFSQLSTLPNDVEIERHGRVSSPDDRKSVSPNRLGPVASATAQALPGRNNGKGNGHD